MSQPLVALQTNGPQLEDPVNLQVKAYTLNNLANQAQAANQARTDDQAARAAFAANPDDPNARLSALAGVSPAAYSAEAKRQADLAKTGADTQAKQLETAHKKIDLAGQAFGYVRQFPTKDNAVSAVNWLGQNGVLSPDQVNDHLAKIDAATPDQIQGLATQAFQSAVAAKDQLNKIETKDTGGQLQTIATNPITNQTTTLSTLAKTQSPDNIATNQRIEAEGKANRATQIQVQKMIGDRQDSSDDGGGLSPATKQRMAQQAVDNGDYSWMRNIGRGKQGAKDLRDVQNSITDYAASKGLTPGDISAKLAEFEGMKAGMRTSANISARVENAGAEADQLAPLAIDAGRKVARSGFLPFGRAQVLFNNQTNDPDMNRFATANMGLATAYAGAMARGGKATQTDMEHARDMLSTAKDQQAYEAIVSQMQQEIAAARRAPQQVRNNLSGEISGRGGHTSTVPTPLVPAPAASPAGTPADIADLLNKYGAGND